MKVPRKHTQVSVSLAEGATKTSVLQPGWVTGTRPEAILRVRFPGSVRMPGRKKLPVWFCV
jgi:hypothetical protein